MGFLVGNLLGAAINGAGYFAWGSDLNLFVAGCALAASPWTLMIEGK